MGGLINPLIFQQISMVKSHSLYFERSRLGFTVGRGRVYEIVNFRQLLSANPPLQKSLSSFFLLLTTANSQQSTFNSQLPTVN
ncbi:hypothetical protein CP500_021925 [Tychonema bourrellyi FEM_GT703]|uniref:Uncharacterized protein n=1 Tax=Tychonema bourrellyi FEM_GT703 TaxID=2040638 RepID=A0A2G4EV38_9CYAN|nr:hypothetical protein CP500_021925 [Tychonema bourrellyi FEM_GT703]